MKKNSIFNVTRIFHSAIYSGRGIKTVWITEPSFRLEVLAFAIMLPLAFYIGHTYIARALLISSWLLVLITELINSAIEITIDRISTDRHKLSAKAKDIGATIVLFALINAAVIWSFILIHFLVAK